MSKHSNHSNSTKSCTLYVQGMHCASCEVLIEKKLLKHEGIQEADATLAKSKVEVKYRGDKPDLAKLNAEFKELGYSFSHEHVSAHEDKTPAIGFNRKGQLVMNPSKLKSKLINLVVIAFLVVGFLWLERSGTVPDYVSELTPTSPLTLFGGMGIIAGISSCAALVGGLLLSMSKQWNEAYIAEDSIVKRSQPHLMFHIGRLLSFFILGGVLGSILPLLLRATGWELSLQNGAITRVSQLIVSVLMLLLALQMLEVSWATKIRIGLPKSISRFAANEENVQGRFAPFAVGVLTFLLPCGFTLAAQTLALTSGSFLAGAAIMTAFAIGTLPSLGLISLSSVAFNYRPQFTVRFNQIVGGFLMFISLINLFNLGANYLATLPAPEAQTQTGFAEVNEQGVQQVSLRVKGDIYSATSNTKLKVGVPTEILVDNQGAVGCYGFMTLNGLYDGFVTLKPGENSIKFTPKKPGQYWVNCAMYMVRRPVLLTVV